MAERAGVTRIMARTRSSSCLYRLFVPFDLFEEFGLAELASLALDNRVAKSKVHAAILGERASE